MLSIRFASFGAPEAIIAKVHRHRHKDEGCTECQDYGNLNGIEPHGCVENDWLENECNGCACCIYEWMPLCVTPPQAFSRNGSFIHLSWVSDVLGGLVIVVTHALNERNLCVHGNCCFHFPINLGVSDCDMPGELWLPPPILKSDSFESNRTFEQL